MHRLRSPLWASLSPCLLLTALLLGGCGPDKQPPLTAEEADKFVHDNRLVQERGQEIRKSLGIMDLRELDKTVGRAKQAKLMELGWSPDRYRYVFNLFLNALRMEGYRKSMARLKREMGRPASASKLEQVRNTYDYMEKNMRELGKRIEETTTVPERTYVHERLGSLSEPFDESAPTFHWIE
jgi:acyl-CoA reductase-like NAD-dependent aldehyde dehydrogenase